MPTDFARLEALLDRVPPWSGTAPAGYAPDFLGAMTAVLFMAHWYTPDMLQAALAPRHVEVPRPRVGDGECYFEWCNVIDSALAARDRYTMVELGGGYGARAVDCALALRRLNPTVRPFLVVVEALPTYLDWCRHHFRANGLAPEEHWLLEGIVSERPVPEMMYLQPRGFGNQMSDTSIADLIASTLTDLPTALAFARGLLEAGGVAIEDGRVRPDPTRKRPRPFVDPTGWTPAQMQAEAVMIGNQAQLGFVSAFTLENVLQPLERVDFMDVDIQFAELQVIPPQVELLRRKVKLLSIGTHSGEIHRRLLEVFPPASWEVVTAFAPWSTHETPLGPFKTTDGILTLRNRTLA